MDAKIERVQSAAAMQRFALRFTCSVTCLVACLGVITGCGHDASSTAAQAPELHAAMTLVELPLTGAMTQERADEIRGELLALDCDVPVVALGGRLWLRLSAQAYNLPEDYERVGDLVGMLLQQR